MGEDFTSTDKKEILDFLIKNLTSIQNKYSKSAIDKFIEVSKKVNKNWEIDEKCRDFSFSISYRIEHFFEQKVLEILKLKKRIQAHSGEYKDLCLKQIEIDLLIIQSELHLIDAFHLERSGAEELYFHIQDDWIRFGFIPIPSINCVPILILLSEEQLGNREPIIMPETDRYKLNLDNLNIEKQDDVFDRKTPIASRRNFLNGLVSSDENQKNRFNKFYQDNIHGQCIRLPKFDSIFHTLEQAKTKQGRKIGSKNAKDFFPLMLAKKEFLTQREQINVDGLQQQSSKYSDANFNYFYPDILEKKNPSIRSVVLLVAERIYVGISGILENDDIENFEKRISRKLKEKLLARGIDINS